MSCSFYGNGNSSSGGGGGLTPEQEALIQNAQWRENGLSTLFTEMVTTAAEESFPEDIYSTALTYDELINDETIIVAFDGVEYVCPITKIAGQGNFYGASVDFTSESVDFSEYPFVIMSSGDAVDSENMIITKIAGPHTISVSVPAEVFTNNFVSIVKTNFPIADIDEIGGIRKIRFTKSAKEGQFEANLINDLLQALNDAGVIQWDAIL